MRGAIQRYKTGLTVGVSLGALLLLLRLMELRWLVFSHSTELYIGGIALLFTLLGGWVAVRLTKPKTVVVPERNLPDAVPDKQAAIRELGLSKRELDVLELMATGCSNQEIADRLFVSLNTVKTHSSRLFEKLEVSRRTQAIEKARRLGVIA